MASATVTHFSFVLQTAAVSDVADTFIHSSPLCRSVFGSEAEHHFVRLSSAGDRPTTKMTARRQRHLSVAVGTSHWEPAPVGQFQSFDTFDEIVGLTGEVVSCDDLTC